MYDVAVAGAGPAGSTCAALCAAAGLRTVLIERRSFPREKVCGDTINPGCWAVLDRLGARENVLSLPHSAVDEIVFAAVDGREYAVPMGANGLQMIAVRRALFDLTLLERAGELGAEVRERTTVTGLTDLGHGWEVAAGEQILRCRVLVAADGRNSTVARLTGLLPRMARERVAIQAHVRDRAGFGPRVMLRLLPEGYCGIASIGDDLLNLCLVGAPRQILRLRRWAERELGAPHGTVWKSLTPLARRQARWPGKGLLLAGDAARVVEPFTGEGTYYALASGELAARCIIAGELDAYPAAHRALYKGRLWINRVARGCVEHPYLGSTALRLLAPFLLGKLAARITGQPARSVES